MMVKRSGSTSLPLYLSRQNPVPCSHTGTNPFILKPVTGEIRSGVPSLALASTQRAGESLAELLPASHNKRHTLGKRLHLFTDAIYVEAVQTMRIFSGAATFQ